ncbi:hypothetical protein [Aestuariivirga sp.]|uniref:hypothetical protein n=1 Tax=Aestuariivirga sp. TaxID=2650926 RepID=UPI0025BDD82B|nr:hypothetical protein [Aestuariivirga sp.]MCA3556220.1 hypothetical protein [Aestuariivirga sp.]
MGLNHPAFQVESRAAVDGLWNVVQFSGGVWQADVGQMIFIGMIVNHVNLLTHTYCNRSQLLPKLSCDGSFAKAVSQGWSVRVVKQHQCMNRADRVGP